MPMHLSWRKRMPIRQKFSSYVLSVIRFLQIYENKSSVVLLLLVFFAASMILSKSSLSRILSPMGTPLVWGRVQTTMSSVFIAFPFGQRHKGSVKPTALWWRTAFSLLCSLVFRSTCTIFSLLRSLKLGCTSENYK